MQGKWRELARDIEGHFECLECQLRWSEKFEATGSYHVDWTDGLQRAGRELRQKTTSWLDSRRCPACDEPTQT